MKMHLVIILLFMVASTSFAEETKVGLGTSTYTIHLKNNSLSPVLLKMWRVPLDGDCSNKTEKSTSVITSGGLFPVSCNAGKKESFCISCPELTDGSILSFGLKLDCPANYSGDLELNLFGR